MAGLLEFGSNFLFGGGGEDTSQPVTANNTTTTATSQSQSQSQSQSEGGNSTSDAKGGAGGNSKSDAEGGKGGRGGDTTIGDISGGDGGAGGQGGEGGHSNSEVGPITNNNDNSDSSQTVINCGMPYSMPQSMYGQNMYGNEHGEMQSYGMYPSEGEMQSQGMYPSEGYGEPYGGEQGYEGEDGMETGYGQQYPEAGYEYPVGAVAY
ncbi:uncharacterized protein Z518_02408 [Rhinocladiella mackenziei CBS 650.93]|uniref:Uncharacterized protein n=1 Tax=Rhinocladiella mackenziei CBS 650.93 TaxID=1442369 RepID=A0A0D2IPE7_9EURO|nr:uncharacterized protein Z518_02408 [Rhinocladiella mackenziei CBS 650.93]KIX07754.1 hypothetical protein Z518_02408 [Rhinocladiella mackenziei CBS 650.93]